ncbi:flagellar brake protein [Syntrophomonas palmitatica]|uniref:flagellar brake protein n=1 Tax=Syntrophomonas palmitatica TaxID=402877 RepID=UPI0006D09F7F|nr:flagellar brake protein [Syntrophomonas palmitatica]
MKPEDIKVNQLLEIEVEGEKQRLPSRVEEIKDNYLYISMPMRKGALVPLWPGQDIKLIFRDRYSIVGGNSKVVSRRRDPLPHLVVSKPDSLFPVNQKREYVRLQVTLPVRFRILNDENKDENQEDIIYQGTTIDISAGGLLINTRAFLQKDQLIELELQLPGQDSVYCKSRIIRVWDRKRENDDFRVAIEFDNITDRQKDKIFKFIFQKQREWIKKGL